MDCSTFHIEKPIEPTIDIKEGATLYSVSIIAVSNYESETDGTLTVTDKNHFNILRRFWIHIFGDIHAQDDPYQYSQTKKNIIIFIVALGGISGNIGNLIYMPDLPQIAQDLDTSLAAMNGTIAVYIVFMGIAPLFWASMSDMYGRKPAYISSLIICIIASIVCSVSKSIITLTVFRAIQACGASSGLTLGAGVIADMVQSNNRGKAFGIFYIGPLLGQAIGPTIGGVLCEYYGWKSSFYFLAALGTVLLSMVTFLLPETVRRHKPILTFSDKPIPSGPRHLFNNMRKAFVPMIVMLGDPTVVLITTYNTVIYACFYFLTPTIADTFHTLYGYRPSQVGLSYLVYGAGLVVGSILSGHYADFVVRRLCEKKGKENVYPEMVLRASFPSFILMPIGYFIYGWTTRPGIGVYAPLIGLFVYSIGQMSAFTPTSVYLVESKPGRSASAVAINNCVRSIVASVTTVFSISGLHAVGTAIMCTILATINIINIINVVLVIMYGEKWRTKFEAKTGPGIPDSVLGSSMPSFV